MAITSKREKLVVFRVTDHEFEALKRVCEAKGGRNLSEFARTELLGCTYSIAIAALNARIASVDEQMCGIEEAYDALARQLRPKQLARSECRKDGRSADSETGSKSL
jgi:hypothetical protein